MHSPLVVIGHHGTSSAFGSFTDRLTFFAHALAHAQGYAERAGEGGKIITAELTLQRPKVLPFLAPNTAGWYARKRQAWIGQGFDGLVIGGDVFAVFWAEQIRVLAP